MTHVSYSYPLFLDFTPDLSAKLNQSHLCVWLVNADGPFWRCLLIVWPRKITDFLMNCFLWPWSSCCQLSPVVHFSWYFGDCFGAVSTIQCEALLLYLPDRKYWIFHWELVSRWPFPSDAQFDRPGTYFLMTQSQTKDLSFFAAPWDTQGLCFMWFLRIFFSRSMSSWSPAEVDRKTTLKRSESLWLQQPP